MKPAVPPALLALWKDEKKRASLLILLGLLGMALLAISEWLPKKAPQTAEPENSVPVADLPTAYAAELETRLEELLTQVEGAGKVQVMVTLAAGRETIYALDQQTSADGASQQNHIVLSGSDMPALVEAVTMPAIQGVAVVCQGGAEPMVQSRITQIVQVLTGVGASHITVTQMVTAN